MSNVIDWAKVLIGVVDLLVRIVDLFEQKQLIDAGQRMAVAAQLQKQADALKQAKTVRESIRTELNTHPDRVLQKDPFTRSKNPGSGP